MDILRPVHAVRVWNAATRRYDAFDPTLRGAPPSPEAADAWFVSVVQQLKQSPYVGSDLLNRLVTSQRTLSMEALGRGDLEGAFEGQFQNHWTDLVLGN